MSKRELKGSKSSNCFLAPRWRRGDVTKSYIYKFMTPLPQDYMLIPSKGTKNLFKPKITCMLIRKMNLSINSLKI